ncbi:MAG TPA: sensor histidine kinase [Caldithrix abyssi]|uniref:histidine kinase n=1 Tax=Caldithrix abyssi TaxID=187145 RepID=A0A7V4U0M1_CALAY|nr:sensor histidine kinase [Caldithrix abyssi]
MQDNNQKKIHWIILIAFLVLVISLLHYNTSTQKWQYHLIYMQAYFIPIILAAFQFGIRGGLGTALVISVIYLPHIMLQWGGLVENNLMRFLQIILFNVMGYLTGLKAQGEREEKERYQQAAKKLEEALAEQKRQLERISGMEQQLRAADRLSIVGELTASLAHEVRNPLGSIRGAVEIIRDAVPDNVKNLEFFDILIQETNRLSQVVESYLRFAKKQTQNIREYDLRDELNNIITMIKSQARKHNIEVKVHLSSDPIIMRGDAGHFWQVALNIFLNAIQAMPLGGRLIVELKPSSEKIRFSVKDEGTGISQDKINSIFKPFFTTKKEGTGLGLAIVKRIADENNWQISVHSEVGKGTQVDILIPISEKAE